MAPRSLIATGLALALAPLLAGAATAKPLPVGRADGVRLEQNRKGATIVFSRNAARLWRQIAGQTVELGCTSLDDDGVGLVDDGESSFDARVPRRRQPLRLRFGAFGDQCTLSLRIEHPNGDLTIEPVVSIPLTQAGAVLLDERHKAGELSGVLWIASSLSEGSRPAGYPTPAQLTSGRVARMLKREGFRIVALAAPTDTPPVGRVGYWSDGGQRAAAVIVSASGRRLFIEVGPDDALRSNVARALFSQL